MRAAAHSSSSLAGDLGPGQFRWANTSEGRDSGGRMWIPQQGASSSRVPVTTNLWISSQLTWLGTFRIPHLGSPLPEGKAFIDLVELYLIVPSCVRGDRVEWCGLSTCLLRRPSSSEISLLRFKMPFPTFLVLVKIHLIRCDIF